MILKTIESLRGRANLLPWPWRTAVPPVEPEQAAEEPLLLTSVIPPVDDELGVDTSITMGPAGNSQAQPVVPPAEADMAELDNDLPIDAPSFLPESIISASLPYVSGDPEEMAWHDACHACGTEQVRLTHTLYDGRVWYIAAPASEFAGQGSAINVLADALPGTPGHKGDGCYQADTMKAIVSVFRLGDTLKTIIGDANLAELYRAENGDPTIYQAAGYAAWIMRDIRNAQLDRVLLNRLNVYSWSAAIVAAALAAISIGVSDGLATRIVDTTRQRTEITSSILMMMQDLQRQPLRDRLSEIRNIYAKSMQYRGTVHVIKIEKGQPLATKIDLPPWVPDADVTRLAAGGTVTATEQAKSISRGKP